VTRTETDVVCTACGCVCDDLTLTIDDERIVDSSPDCPKAKEWLAGLDRRPPLARIDDAEVPLDDAIRRAAEILSRAKAPLIYGLSRSTTAGQQAAVRLADRLGAVIDTTASLGHAPAILALQESGESTCTLGEVRNRADVVVFWGSDPLTSHPRHLERYSVEPAGLMVRGRQDRTVIVVDAKETETARRADVFMRVEPGTDFEVLWALRALIADKPVDLTGLPAQLPDLASRMKAARFGIVFFGLGPTRGATGHRTVEAILRLTIDLNRFSRWYARRMRVSGDVAGADSVLLWQTGYAFSVDLRRGYPRYNPGEFSGPDLLRRGEVDACLLVGSHGLRRFSAESLAGLAKIPLIVLDPPDRECPVPATVRITTAVPGIHIDGTAYRMDEVPLPLRARVRAEWPSDAEVIGRIEQILPYALDQMASNP